MSRFQLQSCCVIFMSLGLVDPAAAQQQVTVTAPLQSVRDSFFESSNVGWSLGMGSGSNVRTFARFGSPSPPPFGGVNPNAGLTGGFRAGGGDFNAGFRFNFAQGAQRSFTTTAPVLTLTNGVPGSLFIGRQRPFVTGLIPVVGAPGFAAPFPAVPLPILAAPAGSAPTTAARVLSGELALPAPRSAPHRSRPAAAEPAPRLAAITVPPSPAELQQQRSAAQAEGQLAAREKLRRGRQAEADGKPQVAAVFYRLAARSAHGELKQELLADLARLNAKP